MFSNDERPSRAVAAVRKAVSAVNDGDVEGYLRCFEPDAIRRLSGLSGPDVPLPLSDIGDGLRELMTSFTGLQLQEESLFGDDHFACARWRLQGAHTADYGGHRATGRSIDVATCEVYAVNDAGLVSESWVYGDVMAIFDQIAAEPAVSA